MLFKSREEKWWDGLASHKQQQLALEVNKEVSEITLSDKKYFYKIHAIPA